MSPYRAQLAAPAPGPTDKNTSVSLSRTDLRTTLRDKIQASAKLTGQYRALELVVHSALTSSLLCAVPAVRLAFRKGGNGTWPVPVFVRTHRYQVTETPSILASSIKGNELTHILAPSGQTRVTDQSLEPGELAPPEPCGRI